MTSDIKPFKPTPFKSGNKFVNYFGKVQSPEQKIKENNANIDGKFDAVTGGIKSIIAQHINSVKLPPTEDQPAEAAEQAGLIIELATKAGLGEIKLNESENITVSKENIEQAKRDIKNKILEAAATVEPGAANQAAGQEGENQEAEG